MDIKSKLESVKMPKLIADLKHANQFLKVYSLCTSILAALSISIALLMLFRGPTVVALAPSGVPLTLTSAPEPEREVEAALRKYIDARYSWDQKSVQANLALARAFVHPSSVRSFDQDLLEVQRFAIDRSVSQRGYASTFSIDLSKQVARVRGDRVTVIQGLTAAGPLSLTLQFESGPRTRENPWGIYVVREKSE